MVKSGLPVRYKNGDKSNYVRRGPNYHIPLRNPCEQKNPTEPLKRPLFPLLCWESLKYQLIIVNIAANKENKAGTIKFTLSHALDNIYTCLKLSKYWYTSLNTLYLRTGWFNTITTTHQSHKLFCGSNMFTLSQFKHRNMDKK